MTPWIYLAGILVVGLLFVLVPVTVDAFLRFRGKRCLVCPEAGTRAEVGLDARYAAFTAVFRATPRVRVKLCSLWPERQGCAQTCLRLPAVSEDAEPAQRRAS